MGRGKNLGRRRAGGKKRSSNASLSQLLERRQAREAGELLARARAAARAPLDGCLVNAGWEESGMAAIRIARRRAPGKLAVARLLVDLHGIGVKDATLRLSVRPDEDGAWVGSRDLRMTPMDPALALAVVRAGRQWGRSLGFPEPAELPAALCVFGDIEPANVEIPCGVDGRPRYVVGPHDDLCGVTDRLREAVGRDGFEVVVPEQAFDSSEVDTFAEYLDACLTDKVRAMEPDLQDTLIAIATGVWNVGLLVDSASEIVSQILPDADAGTVSAMEAIIARLHAERVQAFADADFRVTPEIRLLATLECRDALYWT